MGLVRLLRRILRIFPFLFGSLRRVLRGLPKEQRKEIYAIAKNPESWEDSLHAAWEVSKVASVPAKEAWLTLSRMALGRKISRTERVHARKLLAKVGLVIPPLLVFRIPGSEVLLGVMARATPYSLLPDDWIPVESLRSQVRDKEESMRAKELLAEASRVIEILEG